MTDREPMLSETELRTLLLGAPEPTLGEERRERLRARLGLEAPVESLTSSGGLETVDISVDGGLPGRGRRRRLPAQLGAVAAALLLGGLLVIALRGSDDSSVLVVDDVAERPTSEPAQAVEPPAADPTGLAFCTDQVAPLRQAVDTWDGVENWAFLTDRRLPEPDLVTFVVDALGALQLLEADESIDAALEDLAEVRSDGRVGPEIAAPFGWTRAERLEHQEAVESAIEVIEARIAERGWSELGGCR